MKATTIYTCLPSYLKVVHVGVLTYVLFQLCTPPTGGLLENKDVSVHQLSALGAGDEKLPTKGTGRNVCIKKKQATEIQTGKGSNICRKIYWQQKYKKAKAKKYKKTKAKKYRKTKAIKSKQHKYRNSRPKAEAAVTVQNTSSTCRNVCQNKYKNTQPKANSGKD